MELVTNKNTYISKYEISELKLMVIAKENYPTKQYEPINFYKNIPIHLILSPENLPGEAFKIDAETGVLGSNFGRIKYNEEIIPQIQESAKNYDYLQIKFPVTEYVYRIIARAWCEKPLNVNETLCVHHINNNGFDNRSFNLIWVSQTIHNEIHQFK
jgi:hypothetical protein